MRRPRRQRPPGTPGRWTPAVAPPSAVLEQETGCEEECQMQMQMADRSCHNVGERGPSTSARFRSCLEEGTGHASAGDRRSRRACNARPAPRGGAGGETVPGSHCGLAAVPSLSATCRRFAELIPGRLTYAQLDPVWLSYAAEVHGLQWVTMHATSELLRAATASPTPPLHAGLHQPTQVR